MKTIDNLYNEILEDENLRKEFLNVAIKGDGVRQFLKDHDCDVTEDELMEYLKKKRNISDEEMSLITGGKSVSINELIASVLTLGTVCAVAAISSATSKGYAAGTGIEGSGMLCGKGSSVFDYK